MHFMDEKNDSLVVEKTNQIDKRAPSRHFTRTQFKVVGIFKSRCRRNWNEGKRAPYVFSWKKCNLENLIGICRGGEATSTGSSKGIISRFEIHLKKVNRSICVLHLNELPFRPILNALNKSSTRGPRTSTDQMSKQMESSELLVSTFFFRFFTNNINNN